MPETEEGEEDETEEEDEERVLALLPMLLLLLPVEVVIPVDLGEVVRGSRYMAHGSSVLEDGEPEEGEPEEDGEPVWVVLCRVVEEEEELGT